MTKHD